MQGFKITSHKYAKSHYFPALSTLITQRTPLQVEDQADWFSKKLLPNGNPEAPYIRAPISIYTKVAQDITIHQVPC